MKKRALFLFNPKAGTGQIRHVLADILDLFCRHDYELLVHATQKAGEAPELVQHYAQEVDLIVCCGGDGTLDEVVTGLMRSRRDTPVGYIPTGSTNDFANSLFMPKDPIAVAENILKGNSYRCDVGRFNDRTFIYVAAFGLFTDVSYQTSQDMKNTLGHVAYLLEGAKKLFDIKSFHLKVQANGMVIEKDFVYGMVTNSRSIGGFKNLTRDVDMNDGLFEVTLIEMPKDAAELSLILGAIMMEEDNTEFIHTFKTSAIRIESKGDCPWTLDGEYGGSPALVEIENRHKALNLCLTSTKPALQQA